MSTRPSLAVLVSTACLFAALAASASAATIPVTTQSDDNNPSCGSSGCSLREAIATANSGDTITVPTGTYKLTNGELDITKSLTITGTGTLPSDVTIDAQSNSTVIS